VFTAGGNAQINARSAGAAAGGEERIVRGAASHRFDSPVSYLTLMISSYSHVVLICWPPDSVPRAEFDRVRSEYSARFLTQDARMHELRKENAELLVQWTSTEAQFNGLQSSLDNTTVGMQDFECILFC
jgi:hypothetical protein